MITGSVALWSVGLLLYLPLIALIWQRWLTVAMTPATLSPPYWILMGATAISVLAGSDILTLRATLPAISAIAGFVKGVCFVFWAFGTCRAGGAGSCGPPVMCCSGQAAWPGAGVGGVSERVARHE